MSGCITLPCRWLFPHNSTPCHVLFLNKHSHVWILANCLTSPRRPDSSVVMKRIVGNYSLQIPTVCEQRGQRKIWIFSIFFISRLYYWALCRCLLKHTRIWTEEIIFLRFRQPRIGQTLGLLTSTGCLLEVLMLEQIVVLPKLDPSLRHLQRFNFRKPPRSHTARNVWLKPTE